MFFNLHIHKQKKQHLVLVWLGLLFFLGVLIQVRDVNAAPLSVAQQTKSYVLTGTSVANKWRDNGKGVSGAAGVSPGYIDEEFIKFLGTSVPTSINPEERSGYLYSRRPNSMINDNEDSFPVSAGNYYYLVLTKGSAEVEYRVYEVSGIRHSTIQGGADDSRAARVERLRTAISCGSTCGVRLVASVNRVADPNFEGKRLNEGYMFVPGNLESLNIRPGGFGEDKKINLSIDSKYVQSGDTFYVRVSIPGYNSPGDFISSHPRIVFFKYQGEQGRTAYSRELTTDDFSQPNTARVPVNLANDQKNKSDYRLILVNDNGSVTGPAISVGPKKECISVLNGSSSNRTKILFLVSSTVDEKSASKIVNSFVEKGLKVVEPYKSNIDKFEVKYEILNSEISSQINGVPSGSANFSIPQVICNAEGSSFDFYVYLNISNKRPVVRKPDNGYMAIILGQPATTGVLSSDEVTAFIHEFGHYFKLNDEYVEEGSSNLVDEGLNCATSISPTVPNWSSFIGKYVSLIKNYFDSLYFQTGYFTGNPNNCFNGTEPIANCFYQVSVSKSTNPNDRVQTIFSAGTVDSCASARQPSVGKTKPIVSGCMYKPDLNTAPLCRYGSSGAISGFGSLLNVSCTDSSLNVPAKFKGGCGYDVNNFSPTINSIMSNDAEPWPSLERVYGPVNESIICKEMGSSDGICSQYSQ